MAVSSVPITRTPRNAGTSRRRRVAAAFQIQGGGQSDKETFLASSSSFLVQTNTKTAYTTVPSNLYFRYNGAGTTEDFTIHVASGVGWEFDWGDGTNTTGTGTGFSQAPSHLFASGTFDCTLTVDTSTAITVMQFALAGNLDNPVPDPANFANVTTYNMSNNSFIEPMPKFTNNLQLTTIVVNGNSIKDTFPAVSQLSATLLTIFCYDNQLYGAIPDLSAMGVLTVFRGDDNNFTSYAGASFNAAMTSFKILNNAVSSVDEIDRILAQLDTAGANNGSVTLSGGTNAIPSAAGLTSKTNLEGKGWTVTVNS